MKRCATAIVEYESSGDEDVQRDSPPPKKRKLPPLSAGLMVPVPIDDPALHQGRIRAVPHVDGNWAAHVYLSIIVQRSHPMCSLLEAATAEAQQFLPSLQSLVSPRGTSRRDIELHVSLSRPIFIRAHQKEELRRAVKQLARRPPFKLSFTSFAELKNDECTRTFLTIEIGAGHHELQSLCSDLKPLLQNLRQPSYYSTPRFHASLAWALLDGVQKPPQARGSLTIQQRHLGFIASSDNNRKSTSPPELPTSAEFATVPGLPEELIHKLNNRFGDRIASPSVGSFNAENISLKIGKDSVSWPFVD